jgi:hypothetical protein
VKSKLSHQSQAVKARVRKEQQRLIAKITSPDNVRFVDKLSFTLGLLTLTVTLYFLLKRP